MWTLTVIVACLLTPMSAWAQTAPPRLPANDTAFSIGWSGNDLQQRSYDSWSGGFVLGVSGGHYWTDHLKTEIDASWNNSGRDDVYEDLELNGALTYAELQRRAFDARVGVTQLYQFGRNTWVHPFLGAGVDLVHRRTTTDRPDQTRTVYLPPNRSVPVVIPAARERLSDTFAQAVLRTGLKMYATEKAFFTTELKLGFRENVDHVVWKMGFGVDF